MQESKALQGVPISPIQERIQAWKAKEAKEDPGVAFKLTQDSDNANNIRVTAYTKSGEKITTSEHSDILASLYSAVSGSGNDEYGRLFIAEALAALMNGTDQQRDLISNAFNGAMLGMEPKDIIESQLCAKLLILQSKAMHFMKSVSSSNNTMTIDLNINRATKLMRLHNETLEALNRYRRKGEQKMTIQHVNVNNGGQAVVASEFTPGGSNAKKER